LLAKQQAVAIALERCYGLLTARKQNDLKALRNMIGEAHDILRTTPLPEGWGLQEMLTA